jgi:putative transposase
MRNSYPSNHWRQIRTNNPLERIIREIRRRTRVVGAFPDGHSALMLSAARLRHVASTKWGKRRYLSMEVLINPAKQEAAA